MSMLVPADGSAGCPVGSEVSAFRNRLVGQLVQRSSALRGSGWGNGVLLGRVGGMKSWCICTWSSGGLGGPGDTGFDAVIMIEASSMVASPASSPCIDWVLSARETCVSIVRASAWLLPSWSRDVGPHGGSMFLPKGYLYRFSVVWRFLKDHGRAAGPLEPGSNWKAETSWVDTNRAIDRRWEAD
jgi:hypothetical protein